MSGTILVIAPHPDDEILGCGGAIAKAIDQKKTVFVLYLSSGDNIEKIRESEAKKVGRYIGIKKQFFLRLKGETFTINQKNIKLISQIFKKIKPDFIYINHDQDSDYEHKISYQLITEAHWRYNAQENENNKIKAIVLYEIHKPMQQYNLVEDISKYIQIKMRAMKFYKSQIEKSRIDQAIKGLNQYRGVIHEDCEFAEVFQIKRLRNLLS